MKRKDIKNEKFDINVHFPPFLEGFNLKEEKNKNKHSENIAVDSYAVELLKRVMFDNESFNTTITRVVENYLLLIELVKTYKTLVFDALKYGTYKRLEKVKPKLMLNFLGYNIKIAEELDKTISKELSFERQDYLTYYDLGTFKDTPLISNDLVLPALGRVTYQDVLNTLVEQGFIAKPTLERLKPKTEYGLIASTIYKTTMALVEAEISEMIAKERIKVKPQNDEDLLSRISRLGEILE